MLEENLLAPNTKASHDPKIGFRALATYKEFQGAASSQLTKKTADKNTARYRGLYKKIEEEDRQREQKERASQKEESAMTANALVVAFIGRV